MTKKSILFTNLFLCARTGSELHVLELAKHFKKDGWDVTCFTLVKAYPLQKYFDELGIKLITAFENEDELEPCYDVLFAQHKCVSEYLVNSRDISFNVVISSILGLATITDGHESLPYYKNEVDMFLFVSEEARASCDLDSRLADKSFIFPNYTTEEYFYKNSRVLPSTPHKIAVISNHVPQEVQEFKKLMEQENSAAVALFGYETKSVKLTPDLFQQFDLIISIGRTAQACFASKTPFYCYDHFGGPGFIALEEIELHGKQNFSGRSRQTKRSAQELKDDILTNYPKAVKEIEQIYNYACNNYSFNILCRELKERIEKLLQEKSLRKIPFAENRISLTKSINACHKFVREYKTYLGTGEVFFENSGVSSSSRFKYRYNNSIEISKSDIGLDSHAKITRFDPDIVPCICELESKGSALNADEEKQGVYTFLTRDPIYLIQDTCTITFSAQAIANPLEALEGKIDCLNKALEETKSIKKTAKQLGKLIRNKI